MKKILKNERGVALLITILMITIIVVLTLQFNSSMRYELQSAVNSKNNIQLGYIAKSGYNFALALLSADETNVDSPQDDWALLREYSSLSGEMFNDGEKFQVEVNDLTGKIPINRLIKNDGSYNEDHKLIMMRLLTSNIFELEEAEAEDIIDNIKDWIDRDDDPTRFGSESSYYQTLDDPYSCRNNDLRSVTEMRWIRGITDDILFGTKEKKGLIEFLTVYGDENGKININTAGRNVILALSDDLDESMVDDIIDYRSDEENELNSVAWYKIAIGTSDNYINESLLTVKSSYFEIRSSGIKDDAVKELKAVVKRADNKLFTLSWEII